MADKLVVLTFLLLFVSFKAVTSDGVPDHEAKDSINENLSPAFEPGTYFKNAVENSVSTKEKSVKGAEDHQHVEEPLADDNSEDNSEDKSQSAEDAESKGSPGFFSQVLSELAAPLYEEDEQDFLSEDSDSDPPTEEQARDDDPEDALAEGDKPNFVNSGQSTDQETQNANSGEPSQEDHTEGDKPEETRSNDKGDKPIFSTPVFMKSITENVHSARTTFVNDIQSERPLEEDTKEGLPEASEVLSDEDLEHLRVKSKPVKEEGTSDVEEVEDPSEKRKEEKEEQDAKERAEEQAKKEEEERAAEEEKQAVEEERRRLALEKERVAEEKKRIEEQEKKLALEKEKRAAEEKKREMEEQTRKLKLEKEKKAAEEERQKREEEARQIRLESLKQQHRQIEENKKREAERARKEKVQKEREESLKKQTDAKGNKEVAQDSTGKVIHRNDKVLDNGGTVEEKVKLTQEKGKTSKDEEDDEHMKLKGAFDRKMAEEEAALKRKLELLNEERQNFEKMAEEYRVSKKERQRKEQKGNKPTKQTRGKSSKAATTVSQSSKQDKTTQDQAKATTQTTARRTVSVSATKAGSTGGSTTMAVPGTHSTAAKEEPAVKETDTKAETTPDESSQETTTDVKEPIGRHTKEREEIKATPTLADTTTTTTTSEVEDKGLSSVDVKTSHATDGEVKTEHLDVKKDSMPTDKAQCAEGFCRAKPDIISLASRFQKVESGLNSKVVLGETQFKNVKENDTAQVNETLSGYATFMRAFRNFHETVVNYVFSYWPVAKNTTRNLLSYVGLDGLFIQMCNDLAEVHPAILFITFLCGTLGFLYFFWSLTFGRMRHGAQGPSPHDVLRSYEARVRILEEEVKSAEAEKVKADMAQNNAYKEKLISEEQLKNTNETIEKLTKALEKYKKEKQDLEALVKEMRDKCQKLIAESKEKSEEIDGCENMIFDLKSNIETKESEIQKLNDSLQEQQREKEAGERQIKDLDATIQQANVEKEELEQLLTETKEKKQNLQVEFDDQLLRLTELQQQYEFRCNEVEVLKDCLKQIKLQTDGEEEPDEDEMAERMKNLMNVNEIKSENHKLQEKVTALETEAEELRKIKKMLENDNVEKTERLEQAESKASQAMLSQREKEIELLALQKYFKSTEVELHRKITAEESSRISIENQLQSEQAKASTAVVDADKYRQLYLDIKKQIEEIDESKKEQLSNMEKKAHQNWLDYRAAVRELDGLKDENEILRRKLYDLEVRGSRPSSSASSQLNHVDGRDSPSRRSPMSGLPGHGSPVPFGAPPMMGPPPPPPPSSMFPGQRRPHPAEMLGMTPPRPPFPPPGPASRGHATPPPTTNTSTPQSSKKVDRSDSFGQDSNDGAIHPPPPPMPGYGPRPPLPPMMRMPMFPPNRPMMPPPPSGPLPPPMFLPRPGGPMPPPPPQGSRPQASSTPNRS
ncbi:uncharacterized protein LOC144636697 isoform X2 [Oculina patagonica]